jgi:osmotically-inducible protein OsmY
MKRIDKIFITWFIGAMLIYSSSLMAADLPSDKDISQAVENEMLFNATTPSYLIDVETFDGIVTLSGNVNNILAKDRAVKIARTVKGVRAVVDQIEVNAPYRTDMAIERDVTDALLQDPATDSYEVQVEASNGKVNLTGSVDSWQEKQLSGFVAKGVKGVKELENNISIDYKLERSDFEIKNDIIQTLRNDLRIDDEMVDVEVKNGKVNLSGIVGSANEKALASSLAWTSGVNDVEAKDLEVQNWARNDDLRTEKYVTKSDDEIRDAVKDAFLYDPRVYSFNPDVTVRNGVVTLSGEVDNLKAKRAATQDARNVVGVFRVKNFLKVRPAYIPEDNQLESTIETSIKNDPNVEMWQVDVTVNNGVVYLNGSVDSYFEKITAEDIASKAQGVVAVENNLGLQDKNDYYFYDYYGWNTLYPPYQIDIEDDLKTDAEIKDDIESQLWWSPYVNEDEVEVTVNNGTAILEGTVDTKRERQYAEINALEGGALSVDNNLAVSYTP